MKTWFSINAGRNADAAISIFDDIGARGVPTDDFREQLDAVGKVATLKVFITSNGGDPVTGFAVHKMLAAHPAKKLVTVNGLAASVAAVIALAGDEINMPSNAMLMIANPFGSTSGRNAAVTAVGEALATLQDAMINTVVARSGMKPTDVRGMMERETWLTAAEAVEIGLADRVIAASQMCAAVDTHRFANVPKAIRALDPTRKPRGFDDIRLRAFHKYNGG